MSELRVGQRVELQIEKMGYGSEGLGRFQGLVVFVPFVLPCELIQAEIREVKKHFARARLVSVLQPSPSRRSAPCRYYGSCGGCDWQHMEYSAQQTQKQSVFQDILRRHKITWGQPLKIVNAPHEWHYRNRVQVVVTNGRPSFKERSSHREIPIDHCLIAEESINERLKNGPFHHEGRQELTSSGDRRGFGQVHSAMNAVLQNWVIENANDLNSGQVWDLFAGSGNLSLPLLEQNKQIKVLGVESHSESCDFGNQEVKRLGHANRAKYRQDQVATFLKAEADSGDPSLVILDPPREGLGAASMQDLAAYKPKRILYISCDPMTWARDVSSLLQSGAWELKDLVLLDMFPQTHHIEIASRFDLALHRV